MILAHKNEIHSQCLSDLRHMAGERGTNSSEYPDVPGSTHAKGGLPIAPVTTAAVSQRTAKFRALVADAEVFLNRYFLTSACWIPLSEVHNILRDVILMLASSSANEWSESDHDEKRTMHEYSSILIAVGQVMVNAVPFSSDGSCAQEQGWGSESSSELAQVEGVVCQMVGYELLGESSRVRSLQRKYRYPLLRCAPFVTKLRMDLSRAPWNSTPDKANLSSCAEKRLAALSIINPIRSFVDPSPADVAGAIAVGGNLSWEEALDTGLRSEGWNRNRYFCVSHVEHKS
jgi:hypothetical protein